MVGVGVATGTLVGALIGVGVGTGTLVGSLVGVGVGLAACDTVIFTVRPLPVSVISTCPILAAPLFPLTVIVTVPPLTLVANQLASELRSARSVPLLLATVTDLLLSL